MKKYWTDTESTPCRKIIRVNTHNGHKPVAQVTVVQRLNSIKELEKQNAELKEFEEAVNRVLRLWYSHDMGSTEALTFIDQELTSKAKQ